VNATIPRHLDILFASTIEPAQRWLPLLKRALPRDRFVESADGPVDIALIASPPAGTLKKLHKAKLIHHLWMGVEALLADPELPRNVPLARLIDPGMVAAMSETVLWSVLDWHRRRNRYREQQAARLWKRHRQYLAADHTVGILGLGELGSDAASKLVALDFNVAGWSRRPKSVPGVHCFTELSSLLRQSDAVVCLLPLTAQTRGILNATNLGSIKKGGCIVNLARGGHVVTADLLAALDSGHLAHAYLDVFESEPLPADSPLWSHPRVTLTPHVAALTEPRTAVAKIVENIERVRRGEPALHLVDFNAGY
jgi:glyoxylate/hydroxypyruvate reductase